MGLQVIAGGPCSLGHIVAGTNQLRTVPLLVGRNTRARDYRRAIQSRGAGLGAISLLACVLVDVGSAIGNVISSLGLG